MKTGIRVKLLAATLPLAMIACDATGVGVGSSEQALVPVGDFLTIASPYNTMFFPAQGIGTASAGQQMTLFNAGTAALTFTSYSFTGLNPLDFAFGPLSTCAPGTVLLPLQTCLVDVVFAPTVAGQLSTRLTIIDSANGTPHSIPITGLGIVPGAAVALAGPIDARVGYPAYYQDVSGLKLQLCYDNALMCLSTIPNQALPPLVADVGSNWINEVFYWNASIPTNSTIGVGGKATFVMALEATFFNVAGAILPGDQIAFGRQRIRLTKLNPNTNYTITTPYTTRVILSDGGGSINETIDVGCAGTPCDFRLPLDSQLMQFPFLRWDATPPAAPAGFLGNPGVAHPITGSPTGNNFFRVVGPNAGGTGVGTKTFTNFLVTGEILP